MCDLGGKVYVIGGWNGQCGMRQCNVYDPIEGKWKEIAPLNCGKEVNNVFAFKFLLFHRYISLK